MSAIDAEVAAAEAETDDEDAMDGTEEHNDKTGTREMTELSSDGADCIGPAAGEEQSLVSEDAVEDLEDVVSYTDSTADFTYMIKE